MDRKEEVNRTEMQCLQKDKEHADQWHQENMQGINTATLKIVSQWT